MYEVQGLSCRLDLLDIPALLRFIDPSHNVRTESHCSFEKPLRHQKTMILRYVRSRCWDKRLMAMLTSLERGLRPGPSVGTSFFDYYLRTEQANEVLLGSECHSIYRFYSHI